ncbi:MAG: hypothetical protein ABII96_05170 [Candidatus Zixiibacteriota bacterium]
MKKIILLLLGVLILSIYTGLVSCDKKKPTQSSQDCPLTCRRGDINYNTLPYEVADLVLFAHYFVEGVNIFSSDSTWRDFQICTSDVNKDCKVLTLSDLVYFVRIILHDAVMIKSTDPSSEMIFFIVRNNIITVCSSCSIGAIRFEFDSLVVPTLLATDMEMLIKDNKILVWSRVGNCIDRGGKVISFNGNASLKKVEVVDRDSREFKNFVVIKL